MALLEIGNLEVRYRSAAAEAKAVNGISLAAGQERVPRPDR